jgi:hypothetical protein
MDDLSISPQDEYQELSRRLTVEHHPDIRVEILLELAEVLIEQEKNEEAWHSAREAFSIAVTTALWEKAIYACDVMFRTDQPGAMTALGHGIWLAVTYPISPSWTVAILQHLIDETPPQSNTPPIAAITAHYIADSRGKGTEEENLVEYTQQILSLVAQKHRGVNTQEEFNAWVIGNELDDPDRFLPRLSEAVNNLVQDEWWIDRDALRQALPKDG